MNRYIADLHIHSRFSRATSTRLTLPHLAAWGMVKGLDVIASGDFTHPVWREELRQGLVPDESGPGLWRLREAPDCARELEDFDLPWAVQRPEGGLAGPRFLLQAEVSSIYKKDGAVRKIHNLIFMPDFASADRLCQKLEAIGNLASDGRPILGLDAHHLLDMVLETHPAGVLIPAHVWTPWFSLFGSKSGFDSVEACFGDLSSHIFAMETGLSSDPDMNRLWSHLDRFALVSNSDAHSGENLGREANLFTGEMSYTAMFDALRHAAAAGAGGPAVPSSAPCRFDGTLEFFPEEGKYHLDGHRACNVVLDPQETRKLGSICPVCGKPLTVGVLHRVMALADRATPLNMEGQSFASLIPLPELLGQCLGVGAKSRRVRQRQVEFVRQFGPELGILNIVPEAELRQHWDVFGEAVARMRAGRVIRQGGYDGEYGVVRVFDPVETQDLRGGRLHVARLDGGRQSAPQAAQQESPPAEDPDPVPRKRRPPVALPLIEAMRRFAETDASAARLSETAPPAPPATGLVWTAAQKAALEAGPGPVLVLAGPGSGKTRTLVGRLVRLLEGGKRPEDVVAVTFTRRAAGELRSRMEKALGIVGASERQPDETANPGTAGSETENSGPENSGTAREGVANSATPSDGAANSETVCDATTSGETARRETADTETADTETSRGETSNAATTDTEPHAPTSSSPAPTAPRPVPQADTLHALALTRWPGTQPTVLTEEAARTLFAAANPELGSLALREAWNRLNLARESRKATTLDPDLAAILERYSQLKIKKHQVDFIDLLEQWLERLDKGEDSPPWTEVLVDEIQDLSPLQLDLVRALLPPSGNGFFGIGDPDQAIYSFRGAQPDVPGTLAAGWPQMQTVSLETSFRSAPGILRAATALLGGAGACGPLRASRSLRASLHLFGAPDAAREATWIAERISGMLGGVSHTLADARRRNGPELISASPGEIAVLVRLKALIAPLAETLRRFGIPCATPEADPFWEEPRVAFLLALAGRRHNRPLPQAVPDPSSLPATVWAGGPKALLDQLEGTPPFDAPFRTSQAFTQLVKAYAAQGSWTALLDWLRTRQELDEVRAVSEQVQIMTLHASKGLEFRAVFLPALEEGLLPLAVGPEGPGDLALVDGHDPLDAARVAEERRLFYVGLTRAEEAVFVSHAAQRTLYGRSRRLAPSRFLADLPDLFVRKKLVKHSKTDIRQLSLLD